MNALRILLLTTTATVLVAATTAQELLVPMRMAFRASAEATTSSSTTTIQRTSAYRTQLMYDNSHFLNQGVTGPIVIDRLRFRPEDGEISAGGQVWANVTVQLSDTPAAITPASMSTTFANNVGPNIGATQTFSITAGPASGTVPNDYTVDIPLTTAAFTYDPTTMGRLLISFSSVGAPTPTTGIAPMACSSTVATHLARALSTASATGATGTLYAGVPVCRIGFTGTGGGTVLPALTRSLGCPCTSTGASFYEWFNIGQAFDLAQRSILLTPEATTAPNGYSVTFGAVAPDFSRIGTLASTADDALVTVNLPFTAHFPGGSTTTLKVSTNGFVWLSGTPTATDNTPSATELLGGGTSNYPARLAPFWFNLHPGRNTATHALSGLYTNVDTSGGLGNVVVYLTWRDVGVSNSPAVGGQSVNTFQVVLRESTMSVEYRYGAMDAGQGGSLLVGFSRGSRSSNNNAADPGSRDLSGTGPFTIGGPEAGLPMVLSANNPSVAGSNRAIHGTNVDLAVANVPASDNFGFFMFDFNWLPTSVPNPFLAAGCLQTIASPQLWAIAFGWPSGGTATSPIPFAVPQGFAGVHVCFQFASWNLSGSLSSVHTSNAVRCTIGMQ
jgi:hypothetical protein